jgi:hypothetical protein
MEIINQCKVPTIRRIDFLALLHHSGYTRTLSVAIFIHSSKLARIGTFRTGVCGPSTDLTTVPFGVRGGEDGVACRSGEPCAAATTFFRSKCLFATLSSRRCRFSAESSLMNDSVASDLCGPPTLCVDLLRCILYGLLLGVYRSIQTRQQTNVGETVVACWLCCCEGP